MTTLLPIFWIEKMYALAANCLVFEHTALCLIFRHHLILQCSVPEGDESGSASRLSGAFLNRVAASRAIDLESAAFVFHMTTTTQGITGSLRAACSEPVQRFLACPFS